MRRCGHQCGREVEARLGQEAVRVFYRMEQALDLGRQRRVAGSGLLEERTPIVRP